MSPPALVNTLDLLFVGPQFLQGFQKQEAYRAFKLAFHFKNPRLAAVALVPRCPQLQSINSSTLSCEEATQAIKHSAPTLSWRVVLISQLSAKYRVLLIFLSLLIDSFPYVVTRV